MSYHLKHLQATWKEMEPLSSLSKIWNTRSTKKGWGEIRAINLSHQGWSTSSNVIRTGFENNQIHVHIISVLSHAHIRKCSFTKVQNVVQFTHPHTVLQHA